MITDTETEQETIVDEESTQETDAATAEAEAQIKSEQAQEDEFSKGFGNADDINISDIDMKAEEEEDESGSNSSEDEESSSEDTEESESTETEDSTSEGETSTEDSESDTEDGGTSTEGEEDTTSEQQVSETEDYNEEEAYAALSEETGVQVSSDEDVVNALTELASLRANGDESTLSPAIQAAIKVEQDGGNLSEHFARVGMDFDKMDDKEVLRQRFYKDEAKLYGSNPKLAQAKFERDFTKKYGQWVSYQALTDAEDQTDFLTENGLTAEDIDYEKMMFTNDAEVAKGEMNTWKDEVKPEAKDNTKAHEFTDEEAAEFAAEFATKVEKSLEKFEAVGIQMGEGVDDYVLGLNDTTKPQVEAWAKNPSTFLQDIGFDGKEIDIDKLLPIMTLISEASNGNLGGRIAKYAVDSEDIETIKKTQDKPSGKTGVDASQNRQGGDDWDKIGEAAEQANETINNGR